MQQTMYFQDSEMYEAAVAGHVGLQNWYKNIAATSSIILCSEAVAKMSRQGNPSMIGSVSLKLLFRSKFMNSNVTDYRDNIKKFQLILLWPLSFNDKILGGQRNVGLFHHCQMLIFVDIIELHFIHFSVCEYSRMCYCEMKVSVKRS